MTTFIRNACGTGALILLSVAASAQEGKTKPEAGTFTIAVPPGRDVLYQARDAAKVGQTFEFISSEMGLAGKVVKGAPYSADAVTESTQTLADGNRISRKNSTALYRDGEGRTRREVTIGTVGPWAAAGSGTKLVFINDPVTGVSYSLNEKDKIARKTEGNAMVVGFSSQSGDSAGGFAGTQIAFERQIAHEKIVTARTGVGDAVKADVIATAPLEVRRFSSADSKNARTESLGSRNIEGVVAEGTRTTHTIPAGEIGNERAIDIVSERWYSPELQTVVMTRHSDPRMGETMYKLTNLRRGEPARQLFEVPSDYNVVTEDVPKIFRKKLRNENED